jgi:hypothetical protein
MSGSYFGDDAETQLATILANQALQGDYVGLGLDDFGADEESLSADVIAADMLFSADPTPANARASAAAKMRLRRAKGAKAGAGAMQRVAVQSAAMQQLDRQALARAAGKVPFSATGEDNTSVKTEILPIPPTAILANGQVTIPVRPTRSMQINSIVFPSLLAATAVCRVASIEILGLQQLNGAGGVHCSGLTEVRTSRVLKGSTAQAGQDILITIVNTSAQPQTIEGWFEGPDLVRTT